jgi:putative transposase
MAMGQVRRVVAPGFAHHVVQRGVRAMDIFREDSDRQYYIRLLAECSGRYGLSVWAWALMGNHVHLLVVPGREASLAKTIGETHRRYSRRLNARLEQSGHLFEGRYFSYVVQHDANLLCAARYIELNPVKAGIVRSPEEYAWSSARHHVVGAADPLVSESPFCEMVADWGEFLTEGLKLDEERAVVERHLSSGRPLGTPGWIGALEMELRRPLKTGIPGRKPGRRRA